MDAFRGAALRRMRRSSSPPAHITGDDVSLTARHLGEAQHLVREQIQREQQELREWSGTGTTARTAPLTSTCLASRCCYSAGPASSGRAGAFLLSSIDPALDLRNATASWIKSAIAFASGHQIFGSSIAFHDVELLCEAVGA
jgi:hypothetical protein